MRFDHGGILRQVALPSGPQPVALALEKKCAQARILCLSCAATTNGGDPQAMAKEAIPATRRAMPALVRFAGDKIVDATCPAAKSNGEPIGQGQNIIVCSNSAEAARATLGADECKGDHVQGSL
jgi:hypothetical protein